RTDTLEQVRFKEPRAPSYWQPHVSRDVEAVCLKCLEKVPGRRYSSAEALADDLGRWLCGEATRARPLGRLSRAWRAVCSHVVVTTVAVLVGVAAVIGVATTIYLDPDRPIKDMEARLASGQAVELIGETGGPKWSRWCLGERATQTSAAPHGTFTIHSWA